MEIKDRSLMYLIPGYRRKSMAIALALAGMFSWSAGTVMAADNNLIIYDNDNGVNTVNGPYINDDIHEVNDFLILGNQFGDTGTYTITGNSAQTNVNFLLDGNGGNPNGALIVGNGGTGSFTQGTDISTDPTNTVNVAGDLTLGQQNGSLGSYELNSGTLTVGGQLAVGGQSLGDNTFTQNGGAVLLNRSVIDPNDPNVTISDYVPVGGAGFEPWIGSLAVGGGVGNGDGSNSGGKGTYNLIAGTVDTYNLLIGPTGTGTMTQTGGQVTTTYFTAGFAGTGTYDLQGDSTSTLNAYSETVGYAGTGIFNQSGGVNTVDTTLTIGANSESDGTYNLTGGTLTSGNTFLGDQGTGTFSVSDNDGDANQSVFGNLVVGGQAGGEGTYTITGDTSQTSINFASGGNGDANPVGANGYDYNELTGAFDIPRPNANGALIIGEYGTGTFTQGLADKSDAPTVTVAGDLILGHQGTGSYQSTESVGTYTINGGTLTVDGNIGVGTASTATDGSGDLANVFTQNGGTVAITGSAPGNPDYIGVGTNDHAGETCPSEAVPVQTMTAARAPIS